MFKYLICYFLSKVANSLIDALLLSQKFLQQCFATSYSKMELSCIKRLFFFPTSKKYAINIYSQPDTTEITPIQFGSLTEERKVDF